MPDQSTDLPSLRDEIDRIDDRVAALIAERVQVAEDVATVKSAAEMNLVDENREADVKSHYGEIFQHHDLDSTAGRELAEYLIELSLEQERAIVDSS